MRRKILRTLAAMVLIASVLVVPAFADSATVTGDGVNLRSGPGTNYRVLATLDQGTAVTVTDRSNSSWYAVDYNGTSGFMSAKYLSISGSSDVVVVVPGDSSSGGSSSGNSSSGGGSSSSGSESSSGKSGYINAMYVRFRSGPSTGSSIINTYNKGKQLTVTGTSGDWTACVIDGSSGYVYSQYVTLGTSSGSSGGSSSGGSSSGSGDVVVVQPGGETSSPQSESQAPSVTPTDSKPGHITANSVRFRSGPSTSSSIINTYNKGKQLTITGTSGDWTACTIDGASGYVYSQYVAEDNESSGQSGGSSSGGETEPGGEVVVPSEPSGSSEAGYITGNNVRLRSGPSMSSEILGELFYGNSVTITGTSGDWTAVTYNGMSGYVYSQYVQRGTYTPPSSGSSDLGRQIADYALQYVGYRYTWGGTSPSTGFDCSGLVYYVYQHFGYTLNRVANDQTRNGVHVDHGDKQPGDILCFYSGSSYVGHVGIYIGDGMFVHASNSTTGVIISALAGHYESRGYEVRRII